MNRAAPGFICLSWMFIMIYGLFSLNWLNWISFMNRISMARVYLLNWFYTLEVFLCEPFSQYYLLVELDVILIIRQRKIIVHLSNVFHKINKFLTFVQEFFNFSIVRDQWVRINIYRLYHWVPLGHKYVFFHGFNLNGQWICWTILFQWSCSYFYWRTVILFYRRPFWYFSGLYRFSLSFLLIRIRLSWLNWF